MGRGREEGEDGGTEMRWVLLGKLYDFDDSCYTL